MDKTTQEAIIQDKARVRVRVRARFRVRVKEGIREGSQRHEKECEGRVRVKVG